jgi:hypothetical protein
MTKKADNKGSRAQQAGGRRGGTDSGPLHQVYIPIPQRFEAEIDRNVSARFENYVAYSCAATGTATDKARNGILEKMLTYAMNDDPNFGKGEAQNLTQKQTTSAATAQQTSRPEGGANGNSVASTGTGAATPTVGARAGTEARPSAK